MLKKLARLISKDKFNKLINMLIICPLLYLIDYNWEKYHIIALILSVFILIKDLIIIKIQHFSNLDTIKSTSKSYKLFSYSLLYKIIKLFAGVFIFYLQYKSKIYIKYNVWLAGIVYLNYLINYFKKYFVLTHIIKKVTKINK